MIIVDGVPTLAISGINSAVVAALGSGALTGVVAIVLATMNQRHARALLKDERAARSHDRAEDRAEWYRQAVHERRMTAVQEAYEWLAKINLALNRTTDQAESRQELHELATAARGWYDRNALWLYGSLPRSSHFVGLTNAAGLRANSPQLGKGVWSSYFEADKELKAIAEALSRPPSDSPSERSRDA